MSTLLLPPSHAVRGDSSAPENSAPGHPDLVEQTENPKPVEGCAPSEHLDTVENPEPERPCDAQDGVYVCLCDL